MKRESREEHRVTGVDSRSMAGESGCNTTVRRNARKMRERYFLHLMKQEIHNEYSDFVSFTVPFGD